MWGSVTVFMPKNSGFLTEPCSYQGFEGETEGHENKRIKKNNKCKLKSDLNVSLESVQINSTSTRVCKKVTFALQRVPSDEVSQLKNTDWFSWTLVLQ